MMTAVVAAPAKALVEININKGNVEPLPIAMTDFLPGRRSGAQVIAGDRGRPAALRPVRADQQERPSSRRSPIPMQPPRFEDWKVINAQALVTGRVTQESDGRLRAEFRLWDTFAGQQMTGQQFYTQPENWRRVAHIIADAIYKRITGEEGYFDTRVVFVSETGPKQAAQAPARDHGPGRLQRPHADQRQRHRADAALLAEPSGNHLHVLRKPAAAGLPAAARNRTARSGRQLPRHDLLAALSRPMARRSS